MRKLGFFLLMITLGNVVVAQETQEDRKAAKKARKEERNRIAMDNSAKLKELVGTKKFVLEAHTLYDKGGRTYVLSPMTNFVGFDGENSTIQLAFTNIIGWNGIGGVTLDGRISKLEIKGNANKPNFSINVTVVNKGGGVVTMVFRVSSDGNARVDMSGSYGERLSFQGNIVALQDSRVYKASPVY